MEKEMFESRRGFALRKIPSTVRENTPEMHTDKGIDKIKILELSTIIDEWEQEVLFSENGFYSLKGREVENKVNEFIGELKSFIDEKIYQEFFTEPSSREIAHKIKQEKISAVEKQMQLYSQNQLDDWEISVYENAIETSLNRAVLYKNNPLVVQNSFKNGLNVIEVIAEKENWSKKLQNYRKKQFVSDFHTAILKDYIKDKNIEAYQYYKKYENVINSSEKDNIEKQVNEMRINITANNWAKEIFSYKLEEKEFEKELNNIKDEDIKKAAKVFYIDLKKSEKRQKFLEEKEKNIKNWKDVMEFVQKDIDTATLYIDYSLKNESVKSKQNYINQVREFGGVKTDIKKFLILFNEIFADFSIFKEKDISDYRGVLSKEDFDIFEKIQKYNEAEFVKLNFDFKYAIKLIKINNIKIDEEKYDLIKMCLVSISEYNAKKGEYLDAEKRKKLIESVFSGFKK